MLIIGVLIAVGSAIAFLVVGALTLFGGALATSEQVIPGFRPEQPSVLARMLTLLSVWGPILIIAILCLIAGVRICQMALASLL